MILQKNKNNKSGVVKQNNFDIGQFNQNTELKKVNSFNQEIKNPIYEKKIKIIKKSNHCETDQFNNNIIKYESNTTQISQVTSNEPQINTHNYNSSINYVPKKIIVKEKKINSNFKTNPDGSLVSRDIQIISNEGPQTINDSEYKLNRIFQNESLQRNALYLFSSIELPDKLKQNKNVIKINTSI